MVVLLEWLLPPTVALFSLFSTVCGLVTKVVQVLVAFLQQNGTDDLDVNAVFSNSGIREFLCCAIS